MNSTLKNYLKKVIFWRRTVCQDVIFVPTYTKKKLGTVLFSYIHHPLLWAEYDTRFLWHSNLWESREIVRIFNELGFDVDAIDWVNTSFYPKKNYAIIFDMATNLQRLAPFLSKDVIKILYITGSSPAYQRIAELRRVAQLEDRTEKLYSPKRIFTHIDLFERSLRLADCAALIGTDFTLSTFDSQYRQKIECIPVSASFLPNIKNESNYISKERDSLFFSGFGAVHKGLDLVLETFAQNKNIRLHVVGNIASEKDFLNIYKKELLSCDNIIYHGPLSPSSDKFMAVVKKCISFISPSCSEGLSSAVVTCLQLGLYPIVSKENGSIFPQDSGIILQSCSISEIEHAVNKVFYMKNDILIEHIKKCQSYALSEFSRENFKYKMKTFLEKTIIDKKLML